MSKRSAAIEIINAVLYEIIFPPEKKLAILITTGFNVESMLYQIEL